MMWQHVPLVALPKYLFSGIDLFALEAVPFFILTAELMTGGELSAVLLRFASQFVGRFRGGLGHTNILTLTFFSGISGLGARRCGRARRDHDPHDARRRLRPGLRGRAHGGDVDPRADHSAVDQRHHLRARVSRREPRRPADRGRRAGHRHRGRDGDDQSRDLGASQLSRRSRSSLHGAITCATPGARCRRWCCRC